MDTRTGQVFNATPDQMKAIQGALDPDKEDRFVELPHKPDPECKRCQGAGTIKSWGTKYKFGVCPICYPDHPQKAVSFKNRLKILARQN